MTSLRDRSLDAAVFGVALNVVTRVRSRTAPTGFWWRRRGRTIACRA